MLSLLFPRAAVPYNQAVRRLLAIAIVFLLGLPTVAPLLALTGAGDPTVPACCRRDGKHHCAGMAGMLAAAPSGRAQVATILLTDRCPYGSHSLPASPHPDWSFNTSAAIFAEVLSHPSVAPQAESKRRISADRSRQKRGPPAVSLA
jgi:hypothetical protein